MNLKARSWGGQKLRSFPPNEAILAGVLGALAVKNFGLGVIGHWDLASP
jgi:hypothetical protein